MRNAKTTAPTAVLHDEGDKENSRCRRREVTPLSSSCSVVDTAEPFLFVGELPLSKVGVVRKSKQD